MDKIQINCIKFNDDDDDTINVMRNGSNRDVERRADFIPLNGAGTWHRWLLVRPKAEERTIDGRTTDDAKGNVRQQIEWNI